MESTDEEEYRDESSDDSPMKTIVYSGKPACNLISTPYNENFVINLQNVQDIPLISRPAIIHNAPTISSGPITPEINKLKRPQIEKEMPQERVICIDEDQPFTPTKFKKNTNFQEDALVNCKQCKNLQDNAYKAWNMMTTYCQKLLKIQELQNEIQQLNRINQEQQTYLTMQRQKYLEMQNSFTEAELTIAELKENMKDAKAQYIKTLKIVNETKTAENEWREKFEESKILLEETKLKAEENHNLYISSAFVAKAYGKKHEMAETKIADLEKKIFDCEKKNLELEANTAGLKEQIFILKNQQKLPKQKNCFQTPSSPLPSPSTFANDSIVNEDLILNNESIDKSHIIPKDPIIRNSPIQEEKKIVKEKPKKRPPEISILEIYNSFFFQEIRMFPLIEDIQEPYKPKEIKEPYEPKEIKEPCEPREIKEPSETNEIKEPCETNEIKEPCKTKEDNFQVGELNIGIEYDEETDSNLIIAEDDLS